VIEQTIEPAASATLTALLVKPRPAWCPDERGAICMSVSEFPMPVSTVLFVVVLTAAFINWYANGEDAVDPYHLYATP
jgi:hypothetical protein